MTARAYSHIRLHLGRLKFTSLLYHRDSQDLMSGVNTRFVSDTLLFTVNMAKLLMAVTTNQRFIVSPLSITSLPVVTRTFFLQVRDDQQGALFQGMCRCFYLLYDKLALVQKTTILVSIFSHPIPCPTLQTSIRKLLFQICGTEVQCCQVVLVLVW